MLFPKMQNRWTASSRLARLLVIANVAHFALVVQSVTVKAQDSQVLEVEVSQRSGSTQKWNFPCNNDGSVSQTGTRLDQNSEVKAVWDESCSKVTLQGQSGEIGKKQKKSASQIQELMLRSAQSVELEGSVSVPLNIQAPEVTIETHWSSPELNIRALPSGAPNSETGSKKSKQQSARSFVRPGAVLKVDHLSLIDMDFENQGRMESSDQLRITLAHGAFHNSGEIEVGGALQFERNGSERVSLFQSGVISAQSIEMGDILAAINMFENTASGVLKANRIFGEFKQFINAGWLESAEKMTLLGVELQNRNGTIASDQELYIDFIEIQNENGKIHGSKQTTIRVGEKLENASGLIGSDGPTELNFSAQGTAPSLGKLVGSEILLTLRHTSPTELKSGELLGKDSISIFSDVKVSLPGVQFHSPLLNLVAPDFALDPLTQCSTTVIHCDPKRNLCLTSDLSSQGEIRFLESDYCRYQNSDQNEVASESQALVSMNAVALKPQLMISKQMNHLGEVIQDLQVHFEKDRGYLNQYTVSINSQLISTGGIHFLVPHSRIFVGLEDQSRNVGIFADSLRAFTDHFLIKRGNVSAADTYLAAPGGVTVGVLEKDSNQKVKAGNKEVPLLRRGDAFLATAGDCYLKGPLSCSGTMEVGGNLILDSDKKQYGFSSDIRVKGNLILKGEGDLSLDSSSWKDSI